MPLDKETRKQMLILDISDSSIFRKFKINAIEEIFIKIGGLEKGSFNISEEHFSDGSYRLNFHYPTDMNDECAAALFDSLFIKMENMSFKSLIHLLIDI